MTTAEKLVELGAILCGRELIAIGMAPTYGVLMLSFAGQKDLYVRIDDGGDTLLVDLEQETLN